MIDEREVREMLQRRADTVPATPADTPRVVRRARRRLALNGAVATVAAAVFAVATFAGVDVIRTGPVPADRPTPSAPVTGVVAANGEVLRFTGGDLIAVNPETRQERVLVENLDAVYSAAWSADGRWVAYETDSAEGQGWERDLWVVGGSSSRPSRCIGCGRRPAPTSRRSPIRG
jgi:hypothetical protein